MSIISKITKSNQTTDPNLLDQQELEFLLHVLKSTNIIGEQVEMFYNLVVKLQNQYLEQQEK